MVFNLLWLTWMAHTGTFLSTQKINSLAERADKNDLKTSVAVNIFSVSKKVYVYLYESRQLRGKSS